MQKFTKATVILLLLGLTAAVHAQTLTTLTNSTIKPTGPRTGTSNVNFFNIEGSSNTTNASYGVIDFTPAGFTNITAASVDTTSLTLKLFNEPAAFTTPGTLDFYLTTDTTTNIANSGTPASPLTFSTSPATPLTSTSGTAQGVDTTQFASGSSFYYLGSGTFTITGNVNKGQEFDYTLNFSNAANPAAETYFANQLNTGGDVRFVIASDSTTGTTAATFGGAGDTTTANRPQLTFTNAPEPSSFVALVIGAGILSLLAIRNRTRKSA